MNDNNVIINNNSGRLEDLILLFKTPTNTRKNFFESYRGMHPQKNLDSPALGSLLLIGHLTNRPVTAAHESLGLMS